MYPYMWLVLREMKVRFSCVWYSVYANVYTCENFEIQVFYVLVYVTS